MKRTRWMISILSAALLALSAGCQAAESSSGGSATADTQATTAQAVSAVESAQAISSEAYSDRDLDPSYDDSEAVSVDLSAVTGDYTITQAGIYVLTGTLVNGSVIVNAGEADKVQIVLSGASITSSDGPAIYAVEADKLFITAAENTVSTLTDGAIYAEDSFGNSPDGAIFSRCDLTINGAGTIDIAGNYKFGIVGKDEVVLTGAVLNVTAVSDGIVGKDSVAINGGTVSITAGGDGIVSENSDDASLGIVLIDGGTVTIVTGGTSADSAKGIKTQTALTINGGSIAIDAEDDALHSASALTVTGGTLYLKSGDDGMHSDDLLVISGGEVSIAESYEGIEAGTITISGGTVDITASDDGLNAAGGSDEAAAQTGRRTDSFAADTSKSVLISGGMVTIRADGDGIDSNGSLTITGGSVYISGPTSSANGALDAGASITISGGVIIAAGSSGMAQGFDSSSSQASLTYTYASAQSAGTRITLTDASGGVIVTYAPEKAYQSVVLSAPGLTQGQTYTLYSGGSVADGALSGGTEQASITLSGMVTSSGSGSGGMGGWSNGGGMGGMGGDTGGGGGGRRR